MEALSSKPSSGRSGTGDWVGAGCKGTLVDGLAYALEGWWGPARKRVAVYDSCVQGSKVCRSRSTSRGWQAYA